MMAGGNGRVVGAAGVEVGIIGPKLVCAPGKAGDLGNMLLVTGKPGDLGGWGWGWPSPMAPVVTDPGPETLRFVYQFFTAAAAVPTAAIVWSGFLAAAAAEEMVLLREGGTKALPKPVGPELPKDVVELPKAVG